MQLNGNISLHVPNLTDLKKLALVLKRSESTLVGLALIAIFGYTAYVVQQSINVAAVPSDSPANAITFDQSTLQSLEHRVTVDDSTPTGNLGTNDPFGN